MFNSLKTKQRRLEQDCLFCHIVPLLVDTDEPGESDTQFDCEAQNPSRDDDDEVDTFADYLYSIDLPEEFILRHFADLISGFATICIPGGRAVRSAYGAEILIPANATIEVVLGGGEDVEHEHVPGLNLTPSVLVVRILGDNGAEQPLESRDRLAGAIFGIGNEPFSNSMRTQYSRCSNGLLNFVPADGHPLISNGVMDVKLNFSLQTRDIYKLRPVLREETARLLGVRQLNATVDHVMFCVAPGTKPVSWSAFSHLGPYDSYFNSQHRRCDKLSALMHEMGHNYWLHHSGHPHARKPQYGDRTGVVSIKGSQIALLIYSLIPCFELVKSNADGSYVRDGFSPCWQVASV